MTHANEADIWDTRGRLVAAALGLAAALTNFDVTSVVVVMPAIGRDLGIGIDGLAWIVDAYSIAFTATLLLAGAVTDRFGRRRSLMIGNAWFVVASLACGLAWNSPLFLVARAVQGAAAAFLVTGSFASVATAFPGAKARTRAFAIVGVVSGVAMALGPSLGGMVGATVGWRWIFLANLPLCALMAFVVPRIVAEVRGGTEKPLDWIGVATLTIALILVIDGLLEARHSVFRLLIETAAAIGFLGLFAVLQRRRPQPMLDPAVFASRPMAGVGVLLLAVSVGYWAVLVYLPLFLATGFAWSAETAGIAMLAATLPMLVIPPLAGRLMLRLGWRRLFASALTVMAVGAGALAAAALTEPRPVLAWVLGGMAMIGTGAALSHSQLSGAAISLAPPDSGGMASAVTVIARQGGFAMGVAALGALTPSKLVTAGFAWPFGLAALAALGGVLACLLLPARSSDAGRS